MNKKKHAIDNVDQSTVILGGTDEGHVQQTVNQLHRQWTALEIKVCFLLYRYLALLFGLHSLDHHLHLCY